MANDPSPNIRNPIPGQTRLVYLKAIATNPNIIVGDYLSAICGSDLAALHQAK